MRVLHQILRTSAHNVNIKCYRKDLLTHLQIKCDTFLLHASLYCFYDIIISGDISPDNMYSIPQHDLANGYEYNNNTEKPQ